MKRWGLLAAGLLALALIGALLWPREAERDAARSPAPAAAQQEAAARSGREKSVGAPASLRLVDGALQDAVAQSGAPGSTPPLLVPASAQDGFVEVRVIAQGKPLSGAKVRLYLRGKRDRSTSEIDWRFAGSAETSGNGLARIAARPGTYLAAARSPALAPARHEFQRPAGEPVTRITLELQAGASLEGVTVQKSDKQPVPLAAVTLTYAAAPAGRQRRSDAPGEEQARATSDSSGRFHIEGLTPGGYRATAQATGFSHSSAHVEVPSPKEVQLELAAASFIEGHVITAEGKPAAGAEVFATGGPQEAVVAQASDTGSFSLEVTPRSWSVAAKLGDEAGRADAPVTVVAGATVKGVKIQLGAGCGIAGTVMAALSQQPVAGAQIAVSPHNSNGDSGRAVSDAMGTFAVAGLPPGSYDVAVDADGYTEQDLRGVTVEPGQRFPLQVLLHQTGAVQGIVRDAAGHGVPYALVQSTGRGFFGGGPNNAVQSRTDDQGSYQIAGVTAGHASFTAMRDGSSSGASGSADIPEGGSARLDFDLKDEGVISGHVRRKDGTPAPPDATVRLAASGGGWRGGGPNLIPIDASGAYAASVPTGTYSLTAQGATQGFTRGNNNAPSVTVQAGQTVTQDLVYVAPDDVQGFSGTVLEPDGTPSPGAMVRGVASTTGGRPVFAAMADESGHFTASGVRSDLPDSFTLMASNGGRTGSAPVAPQQLQATVQLQPAATLRGVLTSGPEQNFSVSVTPTGDRGFGGGGGGGGGELQFTGDHFLMTDVPGVPAQVMVRTQDGRVAQQAVTLSPGATQEVQIALQPAVTVTGRLLDAATAAPVAGMFVAIDRGRGSGGNTSSGPDGRFSLGAAAGDHILYAGSNQRSFTAQPGQPLDLGDIAVKR